MTAFKVMGLDLSLTSTGIAVTWTWDEGDVYDLPSVELERVRSTGKKSDTLAERSDRIQRLAEEVLAWVEEYTPHLVVVESPSYASKFGSPHDRSGLWWLVVSALHESGYAVATVSPNGRAKYGTGKGNAKKPEVYAAVKAQYPNLSFASNDEADALLLSAMGQRHLGREIDPWITHAQLDAMAGAAWPT